MLVNKKRKVGIIGGATGWGAQIRETQFGPDTVYNSDLLKKLENIASDCSWHKTVYPQDTNINSTIAPIDALDKVRALCLDLAIVVEDILKTEQFPIVIGGDHSIAIGTWSAVIKHYNSFSNFGLIWLDAHMDANTEQTTPSGAYHGMPVAVLLGKGNNQLVNLLSNNPKLSPKNLVLIGIHSYEEGEAKLLKELGVRIYFIEEVRERGFKEVFIEAQKIASNGTLGYGLSVDLDGFDPEFAPGVGSPEPGGMDKDEVISTLSGFKFEDNFKALEIAEFNPNRDINGKTLNVLQEVVRAVLGE